MRDHESVKVYSPSPFKARPPTHLLRFGEENDAAVVVGDEKAIVVKAQL
jgi:hypothetical protein